MDIDKLRRLVAENKVDRALMAIKENIYEYPAQLDVFLAVSAKYNDLRSKENMGLLDDGEAMKFRSQLAMSVLGLVRDIESAGATVESNSTIGSQNPVPQMTAENKVFISYNHQDIEIANRLKDRLTQSNINVFIDSERMMAGEDIREFIEKSVRDTGTTISLISKSSLLSAWVAMESLNPNHYDKTGVKKKFIACYVTDDFFRRDFTDEALDHIEAEIKEIQDLISVRMEKNRSIRDLQNELGRMTELRNGMDEIVRRLREYLCVDIRGEKFDANFDKILQAIANT